MPGLTLTLDNVLIRTEKDAPRSANRKVLHRFAAEVEIEAEREAGIGLLAVGGMGYERCRLIVDEKSVFQGRAGGQIRAELLCGGIVGDVVKRACVRTNRIGIGRNDEIRGLRFRETDA